MTITTALQEIHKIYQGDLDYPAPTSADFLVRLSYANEAINTWESEKGIFWNELFTTQSTTLPSSLSFNAPATLKFPASYLYVYDSSGDYSLFSFLRPWEAKFNNKLSSGEQIYWMTGAGSAKIVNINPAPTVANDLIGRTAKFDYYKFAATFATGLETTEIEMSDPYYIIEWVLFRLFSNDQDSNRSSLHFNIANNKMNGMRIVNEINPFLQSSKILDYGGGFGV